jgi:hypothetical protein
VLDASISYARLRAGWPASIKFCIEEKAISLGAEVLKLMTPLSVRAPKYSES